MMTFGVGALAVAMPAPKAHAHPSQRAPAPNAPAPGSQTGGFLFHDEFDGPAGSAPDSSKWVVSSNRTPIRNPVGFDRPEF
jgi:beta-glucanase (GH16 family)